ncbi:glycosyltransferase family 4 protein [Flammeovirga sp. MY04]|uniref:glycosyltransferase n=1 Tax=Flammeovirga sp. MY04 TaxID=1191459 RepID=UPI0009FDF3D1|nr:glycosyltransferase family 4 protein [Flammeovirga sp. MY04]
MMCFYSLNEGFGLPILEAQSIGRPVLTSNISSMLEVAGNGALLIDPYDVSSIKKSLETIIKKME